MAEPLPPSPPPPAAAPLNLVRIAHHPRRGNILVAASCLAAGTTALVEAPCFSFSRVRDDPGKSHANMVRSWDAMAPDQQAAIVAPASDAGQGFFAGPGQLSREDDETPIRRLQLILRYNAARSILPHEVEEELAAVIVSLFRTASKASHSCRPNTHWYAHRRAADGKRVRMMRTLRKVSATEELTITYLTHEELLLPTRERRRLLLERKAFMCECERCGPADAAAQVCTPVDATDEEQKLGAFLNWFDGLGRGITRDVLKKLLVRTSSLPNTHHLHHRLTSLKIQAAGALGQHGRALGFLRQYVANIAAVLGAEDPFTGISSEELLDAVLAFINMVVEGNAKAAAEIGGHGCGGKDLLDVAQAALSAAQASYQRAYHDGHLYRVGLDAKAKRLKALRENPPAALMASSLLQQDKCSDGSSSSCSSSAPTTTRASASAAGGGGKSKKKSGGRKKKGKKKKKRGR